MLTVFLNTQFEWQVGKYSGCKIIIKRHIASNKSPGKFALAARKAN